MNHTLYKLDKTKIAFENHCPIYTKLFYPTFNYPKFHAITDFVKCISDSLSAINYDTTYSKAAYKSLFKNFYRRTNKNEYELQILKHNIHYINIIVIQNAFIIFKLFARSAKK